MRRSNVVTHRGGRGLVGHEDFGANLEQNFSADLLWAQRDSQLKPITTYDSDHEIEDSTPIYWSMLLLKLLHKEQVIKTAFLKQTVCQYTQCCQLSTRYNSIVLIPLR